MGLNLSQIINTVRVKNDLGNDRWILDKYGPREPGLGEQFIYESAANEQVTIDHLEFATNSLDKVRIRIYHGSTLALTSLRPDGSGREGFTPKLITDTVSGFWDVLEYNTSSNVYKFRFHPTEMKFPLGLRISVENTDTVSKNVGVYGFGRTIR